MDAIGQPGRPSKKTTRRRKRRTAISPPAPASSGAAEKKRAWSVNLPEASTSFPAKARQLGVRVQTIVKNADVPLTPIDAIGQSGRPSENSTRRRKRRTAISPSPRVDRATPIDAIALAPDVPDAQAQSQRGGGSGEPRFRPGPRVERRGGKKTGLERQLAGSVDRFSGQSAAIRR